MNVLIIEDDPIKKSMIEKCLTIIFDDVHIRWYDNYQDSMLFIEDNKDFIDYIFLDWCFPPNSYSRPMYGMGRQLLSNLAYNDINNKVIICSSDPIDIDKEEFPFVIGALELTNSATIKDQIIQLTTPISEVKKDVKTKLLKPQKKDSGYKRRKSSTPWWMK